MSGVQGLNEGQRAAVELVERLEVSEQNKAATLKDILEKKKGQVYVVDVNLNRSDPDAGKYGDVYFRLWSGGEAIYLIGSPANQAVSLKEVEHKAVTEQEQKELFALKCDMLSRAFVGLSTISKDELVAASDWRFVDFMFALVSKRSGVDGSLALDLEEFFRDRTRIRIWREDVPRREDASVIVGRDALHRPGRLRRLLERL